MTHGYSHKKRIYLYPCHKRVTQNNLMLNNNTNNKKCKVLKLTRTKTRNLRIPTFNDIGTHHKTALEYCHSNQL